MIAETAARSERRERLGATVALQAPRSVTDLERRTVVSLVDRRPGLTADQRRQILDELFAEPTPASERRIYLDDLERRRQRRSARKAVST